VYESVMM